MKFYNWNRTIVSRPSKVFYPRNREDVTQIICDAILSGKKIKVVGGSRHVFSGISSVENNQLIVCMKRMNRIIDIDPKNHTVTVEAGCTLSRLNKKLLETEFCLDIMGGIDKQCIGGLIATSTHGSSLKYGSFSDLVTHIELIDGHGFIQKFGRDHEHFNAVCTNLGALGIVINVTLKITRSYNLKQTIENLSHTPTHEEMLNILNNNDYCEILYFANTDEMVIRKRNRTKYVASHNIIDNIKDDMFNRFQEFLIKFMKITPSMIKRLFRIARRSLIGSREGPAPQIFITNDLCGSYNITSVMDQEFAVPIERMSEFFSTLKYIFGRYPNTPIVGSIRFSPESQSWMAMNHGTRTAQIDISILSTTPPVTLLDDIDDIARHFGARPHWGKRNSLTSNEAEALYPEYSKFKEVAKKLDPEKIFVNAYLERLLYM